MRGRTLRAATEEVDMKLVPERVKDLRLPRDEREAARAERRAEEQMRRERDNPESPERRAAALDAEVKRFHG
jgi:hypothetical protein